MGTEHLHRTHAGESIMEDSQLIIAAKKDAYERSSGTSEVLRRIEAAIDRRFAPYARESEAISTQLETSKYTEFAKDTRDFLEAKVGVVACPDGRISPLSLIDPRVAGIHRRLQGLPETRLSTRNRVNVLNDPGLAAAIANDIGRSKLNGKKPELTELVGPHIHSQNPQEGCGAALAKIIAQGGTAELGMRLGGIPDYFSELGDGFNAFDNVASAAGGQGTTFDLTHDAFSQGFIIGIREENRSFDPTLSLRQNLLSKAHEGKILMTELLTDLFKQSILDLATSMGQESYVDIRDYNRFAENAIIIGRVAREITAQEEKKEYSWIPQAIKEGKTEAALRILAYHAVRNTAYRVLGNIIPGQHSLQHHPEQLIRVGPIGAEFNIRNIPFIQNAPSGSLRPEDLDGIRKLYGLSYGVLANQGVDLTSEGRIILVTGEHDPSRYARRATAQEEFQKEASVVRNNAAWVREMFFPSIRTGEAIVIGCIYEPGTKRLTHIV